MVPAKKYLLLLSAFLVLSAAASAQTFSVGTEVVNPQVNPGSGEAAEIHISVTNTGEETRTFTINYNVARPGWYFLPDYSLTVPPGETQTSILYAEPDEEAVEGNVGIIVSVSSQGETLERRPSYRISRDSDIIITGMETDRTVYDPSSYVNVSLDIKNVRNRELQTNEYRAVFELDGRTETVTVPALIPSEPETLETSFLLGQYTHGIKTLDARVESLEGDLQASKSANIRVREVGQLVEERDSESGILTSSKTITVGNEGNTASGETSVSASLPFYITYFATFTPEPSQVESVNGDRIYTWDVESLQPGESVTVGYSVNYWAPVLLALIILVSVGLAVREYRKPHVVKRVYRKGGTHSVHLRIENRSGKHLENVVVKDFVPSICSLVEKFDASPPEKIRSGGEMTELEWDLGTMSPGEERILTYSLSSQVKVEEEVTLPSAHFEYESNGRSRKRHSRPAKADFR